MNKSGRIPQDQRNPLDAREIPSELLGKVVAAHGWELGVCFYYKKGGIGDTGAFGCTSVGLGVRNGRIAQDYQRRIMEILDEAGKDADAKAALAKELKDAEEEMSEGATVSDNPTVSTIGKQLIMPTVLKVRERDGRPNRSKNILPGDANKPVSK